jgi:ADP-ribose pyrophosphatase YjhB (NUDIX family)
VVNQKEELLFIERNEKWDLPKGRTEKNENIETTSLREVEEETGVQELELDSFLGKTYHIVRQKGRFQLKITHWYLMRTAYEGPLSPQLEEGITQAVWKTPEDARASLTNAYSNVKLLVQNYLTL